MAGNDRTCKERKAQGRGGAGPSGGLPHTYAEGPVGGIGMAVAEMGGGGSEICATRDSANTGEGMVQCVGGAQGQ